MQLGIYVGQVREGSLLGGEDVNPWRVEELCHLPSQ